MNNYKQHYNLALLLCFYLIPGVAAAKLDLSQPLTERKINQAIKQMRTWDPSDINRIVNDKNYGALEKISCRLFERDPTTAAKVFGVYYGSSMDATTPLCRNIDIFDRVPTLQPFKKRLQSLQGEQMKTNCSGTISFMYGRSQKIAAILAAVGAHPDLAQSETNSKKFQYQELKTLGYNPDLEHWSQQGLWEKHQYQQYLLEQTKAEHILTRYYRQHLHMPPVMAQKVANFNIAELRSAYTGNTGASSTPEYRAYCYGLSDLDRYLSTQQLPERSCPYESPSIHTIPVRLNWLLGLAIVNDYSLNNIKKLLAAGADIHFQATIETYPDGDQAVNIPTNDSALMLAAGRTDVIQMLLQAGADPNAQNGFGKTALMYAIQEHNLDGINALLSAGANVNTKTFADPDTSSNQCYALQAGNRTALMYAAWQGTPTIIQRLLDAKADNSAKDTRGLAAADYLPLNPHLTSRDVVVMKQLLNSIRPI